ncbi:MAG: processing protein DprA [Actinomycetota bacterium]|jgi:DNA processing protein
MTALVDASCAAALTELEGLGSARLCALLDRASPSEAWASLEGRHPGATPDVLARMGQRCEASGIGVVWRGSPTYPVALALDPRPPAVLFVRGDLSLLAGRRVGVVGTRNATAAGRHAAGELGRRLALAGVHVVSGLARGIDGCVHRGVVGAAGEGRPIGVVASGLDMPYPRQNAGLWEEVAATGLLLSEYAPGAEPLTYHFPARNRIVAALSEVVVVVESRAKGGSLITVNEAVERGVPVMAVPGATVNRAADGTNLLLRDGATPVLDADDVLDALSIDHGRDITRRVDLRTRPSAVDLPTYRRIVESPATLDMLVVSDGRPLAEVAMSVARLEMAGWVAGVDGWWETIGDTLR